MFAWAPIPEKYSDKGSLYFSKLLLKKAGVAVSPGIGFGKYGDKHVRISLVENEHRIRQAARSIKNNIKVIMSYKKIGIGIVGLGTVGYRTDRNNSKK